MSTKSKNIYYEFNKESKISIGLEYEKYLHQSQSKYQHIDVLRTIKYGNVLYLDNCFMMSEKHNNFYHEECINLVPKSAEKILIIGGGDCGISSKLLKRKKVKNIVISEIDEDVVKICKKYFPKNFNLNEKNKQRIKIKICDGMNYLKNCKEIFDCIIIDSTDPIGEARKLFSKSFIKYLYNNLSANGTVVHQSGSPIYNLKNIINPLFKKYTNVGFKNLTLTSFPMPLYPSGTWSFLRAKRA